MYKVFVRNWWKRNPTWPDGREPSPGRQHTLQKRIKTEEEARAICKRYNATHEPGFLSRKAEYTET
ncbi:unnamed protein product [marine sediment metagenome]|uniref:Uncharacterized protein n=1 Tax=marine sediment metagenome TaxID=412755 RepID=X0SGY7_9ZZZZ